jgi:hypothetical protein
MQNNLRIYHTVFGQVSKFLAEERSTRRVNLALLVTGIYLGASVHLSYIVGQWPVKGKSVSLVNRLRRFLDNQRVQTLAFYEPFVEHLLASRAGQPVRLIIDTTQVGKNHCALVVALGLRKRALPLAWSVHKHAAGNTKVVAQIALLNYVYAHIPSDCEVTLVGDSAFRTGDLFQWLQIREWHFVIRQRKEVNVCVQPGHWFPIARIPLKKGETKVLKLRWMSSTAPVPDVWLVLHWDPRAKKPWILISDSGCLRTVLRRYRRRMWIEEMFGDMKAHGFELARTHLGDVTRIERLMLGVCICYVWLIATGSWVVKNGRRHLLDRKDRRDKSYFRLGLDWIMRCLSLGEPLHWRLLPYF